jgi:cell division protein ZapA (FtsZ GTPase activity inhibitor)
MSEKQATDISIFGHKFTLKGDSDPAYMRELALKVDERMREVSKPGEPIHRVAILASLVMMDEMTKLRRALDAERQRIDQSSRSVAQLDLKLQAILNEAVQQEKPGPHLDVEELPEVLEVEGRLDARVNDLFDDGAK